MIRIFIIFLAFTLSACAENVKPEYMTADLRAQVTQDVKQVLSRQMQAWNSGDIDGFMQDYWRSPDLRFASRGTIARGWEATLERYKRRYPDRNAMGSLMFTDLETQVLSPTDALVFGRWELTRAQDKPSGLFTLHFKNIDGQWVIASDHTSSAQP